ncbi:MAG: hypothetical protein QM627_12290 [Luteolibacter sp.]
MKNFLVIFHSSSPKKWSEFNDSIIELYQPWSTEMDEGLYFISSDDSARTIYDELSQAIEQKLPDTLYVFELCGSYSGGGSSHTRNELRERIGPPCR